MDLSALHHRPGAPPDAPELYRALERDRSAHLGVLIDWGSGTMTDAVRWGVLGVAGINAAMVPAIRALHRSRARRRSPVATAASASRRGGRAHSRRSTATTRCWPIRRIEPSTCPRRTPSTPHGRLRAVAAGKHVLCEKPLAVTAAEAREMARAAAAAGVLLAEAFMYAHHPRYDLVRRADRRGRDRRRARPIHVTFTFDASDELDHSGFQGAPGSGAIYDVGCYACTWPVPCSAPSPRRSPLMPLSSRRARRHRHEHVAAPRVSRRRRRNGAGGHVERRPRHGRRSSAPAAGSTIPHAFICAATDDADIVLGDGDGSRVIAVAPARPLRAPGGALRRRRARRRRTCCSRSTTRSSRPSCSRPRRARGANGSAFRSARAELADEVGQEHVHPVAEGAQPVRSQPRRREPTASRAGAGRVRRPARADRLESRRRPAIRASIPRAYCATQGAISVASARLSSRSIRSRHLGQPHAARREARPRLRPVVEFVPEREAVERLAQPWRIVGAQRRPAEGVGELAEGRPRRGLPRPARSRAPSSASGSKPAGSRQKSATPARPIFEPRRAASGLAMTPRCSRAQARISPEVGPDVQFAGHRDVVHGEVVPVERRRPVASGEHARRRRHPSSGEQIARPSRTAVSRGSRPAPERGDVRLVAAAPVLRRADRRACRPPAANAQSRSSDPISASCALTRSANAAAIAGCCRCHGMSSRNSATSVTPSSRDRSRASRRTAAASSRLGVAHRQPRREPVRRSRSPPSGARAVSARSSVGCAARRRARATGAV